MALTFLEPPPRGASVTILSAGREHSDVEASWEMGMENADEENQVEVEKSGATLEGRLEGDEKIANIETVSTAPN